MRHSIEQSATAAKHSFTTETAHQGMRLDKYLSQAITELSRSRIQQLIAQGAVKVDGQVVADAAFKVKSAQLLTLLIPETIPSVLVAEDIPLDIIYEDKDFLVINKAAGMTVHPAAGNREHTLVHALLAHCGSELSGIGGVARPGIVHRIDKDTSGLLVVAKHDAAHQSLSAQLAARTLKRSYLAVVWGRVTPKSGTITGNIGRSPSNRQKMAIVKTGGKAATTHYAVKDYLGQYATLLKCQLETGRTHQIRVHLTHKGFSLVGDKTYGNHGGNAKKLGKCQPEEAVAYIRNFNRQALHAEQLHLLHPISGKPMHFTTPVPEDMAKLIHSLGLICPSRL